MAIFNKNETPTQPIISNSKEAIASVISKDMKISGEIRFTGKARIDGTIDGNIKGEHLILSETGKVFGDLELISLICHGSIEGNTKAKEVTIHTTANMHGNTSAGNLSVEPGATLSGDINSAAALKPEIKPALKPETKPVTGKTPVVKEKIGD